MDGGTEHDDSAEEDVAPGQSDAGLQWNDDDDVGIDVSDGYDRFEFGLLEMELNENNSSINGIVYYGHVKIMDEIEFNC